jgi:hypothetical protein
MFATVATVSSKKNIYRAARIQGVCADAAELGCNRNHLRLVVTLKRSSPRLLARYQDLKAGQRKATP